MDRDDEHPVEPRRGRPRSEAARRAILEAAYDLLCREGLRAISMDSLARAAGVGKATIYRWWPSKEAVLMEGYLDAVETRVSFPRTDSALADLREQLHKVIDAVRGPDGAILCQILACAQHDQQIREAFQREVQDHRRRDARALLERAVENGEVRPDLDADVAIDALYGPLFHRLLTGHAPIDHEFADALFDVVTGGLRPR